VRVGSGNFTAIAAGRASAALPLSPGSNTVEVRVLSDDKVASRTYSLEFQRLSAPVANPAGVVTLDGTTLSGTIDARSSSAAFQLGRTTAFGTTLPVSFIGGNGTAAVSSSTGPLAASSLYYFRLTGQHGGITDNGTTMSFLTPVRVELETEALAGMNATGFPPGAKFQSLGTPATNIDSRTVFNGTAAFTGANATNNGGIWILDSGSTSLLVRTGANATGGGVFSALGEPLVDNVGRVTFIGSLRVGVGGVSTKNATGIWQISATGNLSLLARAGSAAPGAAGTVFSTFTNLVAGDAGVAFTATLASGTSVVSSSNSTGLWAQNNSGGLVLVARTNASPTPSLGSISIFSAESGQLGQGRHFNNSGDLLMLAKFGSAPLGLHKVRAPGFSLNGTVPVVSVGSAVPGLPGAVFASFSNPILSQSDEVAFRGTFSGNGVSSGNNTAIFVYPSAGNGSILVRTGTADADGRVFQTLSSPVLNGAGNLAFTGTLRTGIGGVSSANATGLWVVSPGGEIETVARVGDAAPGLQDARFATFSQITYPDESGIAFVATLATGNGTTSSNNTGLWSAPSPGEQPVLVVRTGDSLAVGGSVKTVSAIGIFSPSKNTTGAGRGFSALGNLVFRLTFTDKSSGIFSYTP
jgi:hypothetical protein